MRNFIFGLAAFLILTPAMVWAQKPLTFEEARAMALEKVPGVIVDRERSIHNGAVVFEFDIRQENGAVMEIEIDSVTREILELEVDTIATGSSLPEPATEEDTAREIAIKHIEDTTSGLRAVEILESKYTIKDRMLVYVFKMRRGIDLYELVLDANSGKVVSVSERD